MFSVPQTCLMCISKYHTLCTQLYFYQNRNIKCNNMSLYIASGRMTVYMSFMHSFSDQRYHNHFLHRWQKVFFSEQPWNNCSYIKSQPWWNLVLQDSPDSPYPLPSSVESSPSVTSLIPTTAIRRLYLFGIPPWARSQSLVAGVCLYCLCIPSSWRSAWPMVRPKYQWRYSAFPESFPWPDIVL